MSSSSIPASNAQPKTRPGNEPRADAEYIDHGPPLPQTYPGRRARSMVASPHLIRLSWEWPREGVDRWTVVATADGGEPLAAAETPASSGEAWLTVPAGSVGTAAIRAHRGDAVEIVATLPFETPPDGPAADSDGGPERWAQWSPEGGATSLELVDAAPVAGAGVPADQLGAVDDNSANPYRPR